MPVGGGVEGNKTSPGSSTRAPGASAKPAVLGLGQTAGKSKAILVADRKRETLQAAMPRDFEAGREVRADEHVAYEGRASRTRRRKERERVGTTEPAEGAPPALDRIHRPMSSCAGAGRNGERERRPYGGGTRMSKVRFDGSVWYTDIGEVRDAIRGVPYVIVKYGRREHIDAFAQSGSVRIANAMSFANEPSADRRDWETVRDYRTGHYGEGSRPAYSEIPAPQSNEILLSRNVPKPNETIRVKPLAIESRHTYPDHWMYSTSTMLSLEMLQRFDHSCCIVIGKPYWTSFMLQVANELAKRKFCAVYNSDGTRSKPFHFPPRHAIAGKVSYYRPPPGIDSRSPGWKPWIDYMGDAGDFADMFKKHIFYRHQHEMKFAWPFFDFKDVATQYHRWVFRMVNIDTGEFHTLEEARDNAHVSKWMYEVELPAVMVKIAPPRNVIKLTVS